MNSRVRRDVSDSFTIHSHPETGLCRGKRFRPGYQRLSELITVRIFRPHPSTTKNKIRPTPGDTLGDHFERDCRSFRKWKISWIRVCRQKILRSFSGGWSASASVRRPEKPAVRIQAIRPALSSSLWASNLEDVPYCFGCIKPA